MVLWYASKFCVICDDSAQSELGLCDRCLFCVIWNKSLWSELVRPYLLWFDVICWFCMICEVPYHVSQFYMIYDGSALSAMVLRYLRWFSVIGADSAWSVMVLCDLSDVVLHDPWQFCVNSSRFCMIWAGTAWSGIFFWVNCDGFAWSKTILRDLWWFCLIWASSVCSELVLRYLTRYCLIWDGSERSVMVLHDLSRYYITCYGSAWSVIILCDLSRFCVI